MKRGPLAVLVLFATLTGAPAAFGQAAESLNHCQQTIAAESAKYIRAVADTVGKCLFKASSAVLVDGGTAADAGGDCAKAFLKINNRNAPEKTLAGKFNAKVGKACDPSLNPSLKHAEVDTYMVGTMRLSAAHLNAHCQSFYGGDGNIDDFDEWRDCMRATADTQARQLIATVWPRALEYFSALRSSPQLTFYADAAEFLNELDAALEGSTDDDIPVRVGPSRIAATGQTACYGPSGAVIACAGSGQDGELQRGAPPQFVDSGDGTISDRRTGLVWEKLCDQDPPGATCPADHDVDTSYNWSQAFGKIANLNTASYAGHNDWRLPNINELATLEDLSATSNPGIHSAFYNNCTAPCSVTTCSCTSVVGLYYWASTVNPAYQQAYIFSFNYPGTTAGWAGVTNNNWVRAVRGGVSW